MLLMQVAGILHKGTSRSLVIIDEFGKGTLTCDGIGLLSAILQHYSDMPEPPKVLACTHFSELLDPQILRTNKQLTFYTMQVTTLLC